MEARTLTKRMLLLALVATSLSACAAKQEAPLHLAMNHASYDHLYRSMNNGEYKESAFRWIDAHPLNITR